MRESPILFCAPYFALLRQSGKYFGINHEANALGFLAAPVTLPTECSHNADAPANETKHCEHGEHKAQTHVALMATIIRTGESCRLTVQTQLSEVCQHVSQCSEQGPSQEPEHRPKNALIGQLTKPIRHDCHSTAAIDKRNEFKGLSGQRCQGLEGLLLMPRLTCHA